MPRAPAGPPHRRCRTAGGEAGRAGSLEGEPFGGDGPAPSVHPSMDAVHKEPCRPFVELGRASRSAGCCALFEEPLLHVPEGTLHLALPFGVPGLAGPDLGAVELGKGGSRRMEGGPLGTGPVPAHSRSVHGGPWDTTDVLRKNRTRVRLDVCQVVLLDRVGPGEPPDTPAPLTRRGSPRSTGPHRGPTPSSTGTQSDPVEAGARSPGAVPIPGCDAAGAAWNLGPRRPFRMPGHVAHRSRDTPRPGSASKTLVASNLGADRTSSAIQRPNARRSLVG